MRDYFEGCIKVNRSTTIRFEIKRSVAYTSAISLPSLTVNLWLLEKEEFSNRSANSTGVDGSLGRSNLRLLHIVLSSCLKVKVHPTGESRHSLLKISRKLSVDDSAASLILFARTILSD